MTTPLTPEERNKRIEEALEDLERVEASHAENAPDDLQIAGGYDIARTLADELSRREQEHQEKLKYWQCKTCGYIGGNGTVEWTNEEGELCGSECPDCPSITKRAHSEELRKAREEAYEGAVFYSFLHLAQEGLVSGDDQRFVEARNRLLALNPHRPTSQPPQE